MEEKNYNIFAPWETLDDWQKNYIDCEENCFLLCGRQVGKSVAMSVKAGKRAATIPDRDILMIALTEKQAYQLFFKTYNYLAAVYPKMIKKGKDKPTKHELKLINGSVIRCYATGLTGDGLRGFTTTDLFVDEAARIAREVFTAITPMLSVTKGRIDVASTPCGKEGFFYDCSKENSGYKKFYASSEDCPRIDRQHLENEKQSKSRLEYAQEYLAVFLDELKRLIPDDLINKTCILERKKEILAGNYYLGVDVAGMGESESTFEILENLKNDKIIQIDNIIMKKTYTTDTSKRIIELEKIYKFKEIGVDDGGVGFGVFSELLNNNTTKRKTTALNNASREINSDGDKKKKLLKEEMYLHFLSLIEQEKIKLLNDDEIVASLKSLQYELEIKKGKESEFRIFGNYTHIVEGLIRATWLIKNKRLRLFCA